MKLLDIQSSPRGESSVSGLLAGPGVGVVVAAFVFVYRAAGAVGPLTRVGDIDHLFHSNFLLQDTRETISLIQGQAGNWAVSK